MYMVEGVWDTECVATTRGMFAIGHDAKLKSLLISAGVAGCSVHRGAQVGDAQARADRFGFAGRVAAAIERGRARRATVAPGDERPAEPEPTPGPHPGGPLDLRRRRCRRRHGHLHQAEREGR